MADEKPPQPGPVPQFVAPMQVSGPMHIGPWGFGPATPLPPPESKKEDHAGIKLAIQIITVALAVGGIVWRGAAAFEKLNHIEENQKAEAGIRAEHKRQQEERDDAVAKALDGLRGDVGAVKADVASLKQSMRRRHVSARESRDERPPGP